MEDNFVFQEKVKSSFLKFREHMEYLQKEIVDGKNEIEALKISLKEIKDKLEEINQKIVENVPKEAISTGNKGVFRRAPVEDPLSTRQAVVQNSQIIDLKADISDKFKKLTDKEFTVFMTIYQLEEANSRAVSYTELAEKLELSLSSVRDHICNILLKKIPLLKQRTANGTIFLSIPHELKELNLASKLIKLRSFDASQKTLF